MHHTHRYITSLLFYLLTCTIHQASSLCFIVISDTHIDTNDTLSVQYLQLCIEDINQRDSIDFVIHTGDITQSGDAPAMQTAKALLDDLDIPYYALAGNHDVSRYHNQPAYMLPVFGNDYFSFTLNGYRCIGFSAISPTGTQEGYLPASTWQWLEQQLTVSPGLPAIVFSHYPLQKGDMTDAHVLTELLQNTGTIITLSGHYHRYMLFDYNGLPGIVNRSMMRTSEPEPGYTLYRITDDNISVYECLCGHTPILWMTLPLTSN